LKEDIVQLISHDKKTKFPDILDHFENFTEEMKICALKMVSFKVVVACCTDINVFRPFFSL
jgi:hypothetical protein